MPSPKKEEKLQGWVYAMGRHPNGKRVIKRFGTDTDGHRPTTQSSGHPAETWPSIRELGPGTSCHQEFARFPNTKAMKRRRPPT